MVQITVCQLHFRSPKPLHSTVYFNGFAFTIANTEAAGGRFALHQGLSQTGEQQRHLLFVKLSKNCSSGRTGFHYLCVYCSAIVAENFLWFAVGVCSFY